MLRKEVSGLRDRIADLERELGRLKAGEGGNGPS
ncbi:MAG: hypothetical protein KC488_07190 [Candidatus Cloacimonetes bacterium]|nr:hypothetical protein [Candidatus Cloacimonadota bacterium]